MTPRSLTMLSVIAAAIAAAGCSGGGGGSKAVPVPTTAPTPGTDTCGGSSVSEPAGVRHARRAVGGLVPNRLYVTYKPGVRTVSNVERNASISSVVDLGAPGGAERRAVTLSPGIDAENFAASLRRDASIAAVDRLHYRSLASDAVANDQLLNNVNQWYLYRTNVDPGAWALTHGSSTVSIAIIDTGVDLNGAALGGHDFNVTFAEKVLNGVRTTGNAAVQDTNGHGTNVAGLAVAQTNNTYGFGGAGWSTSLMAFKIFPDTTATSDSQCADPVDEALAINDAVSHGASVISLSLGSPQTQGADKAEQDAVEAAIAAGVTVVAAAGNECNDSGINAACTLADGQQPDYPGAYAGVISVGASAVQDSTKNSYASITGEGIAGYSNSHPTLVAPGGDSTGDANCGGSSGVQCDFLHWIAGYSTTTTNFASDACSNSGTPPACIVLFNGTSQATPLVAGTVALMLAKHGGPRSLTPAQVQSILTSTVDVLPGIGNDRQGAGRLNAGNAVSHS